MARRFVDGDARLTVTPQAKWTAKTRPPGATRGCRQATHQNGEVRIRYRRPLSVEDDATGPKQLAALAKVVIVWSPSARRVAIAAWLAATRAASPGSLAWAVTPPGPEPLTEISLAFRTA